ncbi:MAG: calcium-binding EGF-like domain-containing protein [Chitinophagaceae bacterium]|nr:calcium-binding EGF-like domain-containing protein [Chitinophagaceae bacterium]
MKNLRKITLALFIGAASFSSLFTSCNSDPCKDIQCDNGGVCTEGSCDCPAGYEGASCETRSIVKYLGTYTGNGIDDQGGNYTGWKLVISQTDSSLTKANFALLDNSLVQQLTFTGSISSTGAITLDDKTTTNYLYTLGSGTLTSTSANLTFKESDNPGGTNPYIYTFSNMIK